MRRVRAAEPPRAAGEGASAAPSPRGRNTAGHAVVPSIASFAVLTYLAFFSYVAGMQSGLQRGAQAALEQGALEPVRRELDRHVVALQEQRRQASENIHALSEEVIRMQTRLVYLNALAARLARNAPADELGIDFSIDPPLGGPEELPLEPVARDAALRGTAGRVALQLDDRWRQLNVLEDMLVRRKLSDDVEPEGLPVRSGWISSRYGDRIDPLTGRLALHKGVDFAGRAGTPVVAVAAGIVIYSGYRTGYGLTVEIDHGSDRVTRYAHNRENLVQVGDVVTRGQPIARLGDTGRTTGPNLHFEVLTAGEAVDPARFMGK